MPAGAVDADRAAPAGNHIRTTVLPGGFLFISERLPYVRSVALGFAFGLGGRDDPASRAGLAHLVEHMVFKGTPEQDAKAISIAAESLGAELNAFTDKEMTCFYGRFPGEQQLPVTRLLAGMLRAPAFDPDELAKEKGVIAEEIRTAQEDPDSRSTNLMLQASYGDHPLGVPVVGLLDAVEAIDADMLARLYRERYHSGSGVVVATGDVRHEELAAELADVLQDWEDRGRVPRRPASAARPRVLSETRKDLSQVFLCFARPAFPFPDDRRYALAVLNTAFGGGMSSRLFHRLREDEGLVYSVSSFADLYGDSGLAGVCFVTDHRKLDRCMTALGEELVRLRREKLSSEEFERARTMVRSSVLLGMESTTNRMMRLVRTHHLLGRLLTADETLAAYDRLELDEVNGLVDVLFSAGGYSAGAVGPAAAGELEEAVGRLAD